MADIVRLKDGQAPPLELVEKVRGILESGGLIVYPTTTLYGLGASIFSQNGMERLLKAKIRPKGMPISAFTLRENITEIADIPVWGRGMLDSGLPLTFILTAKPNVPAVMTRDGTIAVRFPDSQLVREICVAVGPITATSANRHMGPEPVKIGTAVDALGDEVSLYIDAGPTEYGQMSTILDMTGSEVKIIREGIIPKAQVLDLYG